MVLDGTGSAYGGNWLVLGGTGSLIIIGQDWLILDGTGWFSVRPLLLYNEIELRSSQVLLIPNLTHSLWKIEPFNS